MGADCAPPRTLWVKPEWAVFVRLLLPTIAALDLGQLHQESVTPPQKGQHRLTLCTVHVCFRCILLSVAGVTAGGSPATWRYSLAAHLLPSFWQQQHVTATGTKGSALHQMADQLAVWLMLGAETAEASEAAAPHVIDERAWFSMTGRVRGAGQGSGPGVHARVDTALRSSQGLAGRAVLVGYRLFVAGEYAAMQRLVRLVGGDLPSEAGLQYILGLSMACSVPGSSTAADTQLDLAVGHLFRAAAGLCSSDAGPLRVVVQLLRQQQAHAHLGPQPMDAEAAEDDMDSDADRLHANGAEQGMQLDLQQEQHLSGLRRQQQHEAVLRLQFDQAVMLLFEQKGVKQGALAFARAALGAVEAAYGTHQQKRKQQQQGEDVRLTGAGRRCDARCCCSGLAAVVLLVAQQTR